MPLCPLICSVADTGWAVTVGVFVLCELGSQVLLGSAHRLAALLRGIAQIRYQVAGSGRHPFARSSHFVSHLFGGVTLNGTTKPFLKVDGTANTEREAGSSPKCAFHLTFDFLDRLDPC